MTKNICVIYTGGTIGMRAAGSGDESESLAPAAGFLSHQIENMSELKQSSAGEKIDFALIEYAPLLDSSDMTPKSWVKIATDIEKRYHEFDGFIVLHGTDTLAYTASALSFFVEGSRKPIVVTGSQLPFGVPRSDARNNIVSAFQVAAEMPPELAQVCVVFGSRILRGNRCTKVSAIAYDAFNSPRYPLLGTVGIDINYNENCEPLTPPAEMRVQTQSPDNETIAVVRIFPGFSHEIIRSLSTNPKLKGIVLEAYGTGNGPSGDAQFLSAITAARAKGIVIVVVAQPLEGIVQFDNYAVGSALRQAGAVSGKDMTTEAALAKLYYLISLGLGAKQIEERIRLPISGEMVD